MITYLPAPRYERAKARRSGFTLLEMSMVLTMIGFLAGSIFIYETMIRNSQLRAVGAELIHYKQAINDFRDKYQALPGDFAGATALWGSADGVSPSDVACQTTVGTGTQTCDGNGDGRIGSASDISVAGQYEQFRAWQHLANAGMIDNHYSGVPGPTFATAVIIGTNVPAAALPGAGYTILSVTALEESQYSPFANNYFDGINYGHVLQFGTSTGGITFADLSPLSPIDDASAMMAMPHKFQNTMAPAIGAQEAFALDTKLDDGKPGSGFLLGPRSTSPVAPGCTTTDIAGSALYNLGASGNACFLTFQLGV